jgi:hypothetical protein
LYYDNDLHVWEYDNEALVTVCDKCHKLLHSELKKLSGIVAFQMLSGEIDITKL